MAIADDFGELKDPYRSRVGQQLNPNAGIAGPESMPAAAAAPAGGFDYEKFRKGWAYGGSGFGSQTNMGELQKFIADNPTFASGVTLRGEKVYDPTGKFMFDAIGNYKSGDPTQMTRIALQGNSPYAGKPAARPARPTTAARPVQSAAMPTQAAAPAPAITPVTPQTGGGDPAPQAPPASSPFQQQLRDMLMSRLTSLQQPVSAQDADIAPASQAYNVQRQRGADRQRAELAERAAASGQLVGGESGGGFDANLGGIREAAAEDIASNDAGLIQDATNQRRAELQSLMNMALQSGDNEAARELSMALARMDDATRNRSITEQGRQFNAGLGETARQFGLSDRYRYAALNQDDRQFNADLGYRNRALGEQGRQFDDQFGRSLGRDYEDDYRWRALLGLGA